MQLEKIHYPTQAGFRFRRRLWRIDSRDLSRSPQAFRSDSPRALNDKQNYEIKG